MTPSAKERLTTPRREDLGLRQIVNQSGIAVSILPNGAIFSLEHIRERRIMINQTLGSPIAGGMGGLWLRTGGIEPMILPIAGVSARCRLGVANDRFIWEGETQEIRHRVGLWLHPTRNLWLWGVEIVNGRGGTLDCDVLFVQDLGLGDQNFLMSNEAYASQYTDHYVAHHASINHLFDEPPKLVANWRSSLGRTWLYRRNSRVRDRFSSVHGTLYRDADQFGIHFGTDLPTYRLQHETACAALQSKPAKLVPGAAVSWTFFGLFEPDHPAASSDADLGLLDFVERIDKGSAPPAVIWSSPTRSFLQDMPSIVSGALDEGEIEFGILSDRI